MTYVDWTGGGTQMMINGTLIREWFDGTTFVFLDPGLDKGRVKPMSAAVVESIAPAGEERVVAGMSRLRELDSIGAQLGVVVICPADDRDCELLREMIVQGSAARIFVMVWSSAPVVADMLDGLGALNLSANEKTPAPDPLQLEAAKEMVREEYNGLESGNGKNAVIQLLRALGDEGYPFDERWIQAVFAAGATYRSALTVAKFLREINQGVKHRVREYFVPEIAQVLRTRIKASVDAS